jgi:hypothetical protein
MAKVSKRTTGVRTDVLRAAPEDTATSSKPRDEVPEVMVDGINELAALESAIAVLSAARDDVVRHLKEQAEERFIIEGLALKRRPQNFKAVDTVASASVQLRAKSQPLTEDNIALCAKYGIELEEEVKFSPSYVIAENYAADSVFIAEFEKRLGAHIRALEDERGPIIRKQMGWSIHKISETGQDAIFTHPEEVARALVSVAFTLAVKTTQERIVDLRPALKIIEGLLAGDNNKPAGP